MTPRSPAVLPCLTCVSVQKPIKSTYLIHKANFVACHNPSYVRKYNMVQELVDGGTFLLNCPWDMEGLEKHLPGQVKKHSSLTTTSNSTPSTVLRSVSRPVWDRPVSTPSCSPHSSNWQTSFRRKRLIELMKAAAKATYGRKGDDVVQKNWAAIDAGAKQVVRSRSSGKLEELRG